MSTLTETKTAVLQDTFPIKGTDHIEFYVGNAKQAAHYYQSAFGFELVAYAGPETGLRDRASYVLQQDKIRFVLTSALSPESEIAQHVLQHGDGVKVLALWVDDAEQAYYTALERGAVSASTPQTRRDEFGELTIASIHTYGDTWHTFVQRDKYNGAFMPGFQPRRSELKVEPIGLKYVDHCVGNVELGMMNKWVQFYQDVMGFNLLVTFDDKDISTEYTALMSKVVSNGNGYIKFPINEPAQGKKKSQIEEYLDFYEGPGCQHIAVATNDIISTVKGMRARGVEFLSTPPDEYYKAVPERLMAHNHQLREDIETLKGLGIMIDADEEGYLLQIFTKPVEDRPTLFFEIIQRMGARGFGAGNFKALFESIEREQEKRGTL